MTTGTRTMMTAWVIESKTGQYIGEQDTLIGNYMGWVSDHRTALRMARREDAEALLRICRGGYEGFDAQVKGVCEHGWYRG